MTPGERAEIERRLRIGPEGAFDESELVGLPAPAQRYLRSAIAPGTPLARSAELEMRGHIERFGRWLPFRARELLAPHEGLLWEASVLGLLAGSDHVARGEGAMRWKIGGFATVVDVGGPDVARSGSERAAAEAIWLPTALLPRFGVEWEARDDTHVSARWSVGDVPVAIHHELDAAGRLRAVALDRWGDPDDTGTWGRHRFTGRVASRATFGGLTIPDRGAVGWRDDPFFRFTILSLRPVAPGWVGSTEPPALG